MRGKSSPQLAISETELREQIRDLCKYTGWKFYFTWNSYHSPKGLPDLILRKKPRLIFAELKSEKGELSDAQLDWYFDLKESGFEVYIWRPSMFNQIVEILQGKGNNERVNHGTP